ncbi:MAG: ABC transporter permease [Betaproteobacteria bacterium]|nr:MAG: ABC transporter permease [Betaproteobacteria bacterium]
MFSYVARRLFQLCITLMLVSIVVFLLGRLSGDPLSLILPPEATEQDFAAAREQLGLDQPLWKQYSIFAARALRGDLGDSITARRPVFPLVMERLPSSLALAGATILLTLLFAVPLGVISAVRKGSYIDFGARLVALLGQSVPSFWLGLILLQFFAVQWRLLPFGDSNGIGYYVLPSITLAAFIAAGIMRLVRSSMLDAMDSDYVKFARSKGVPEWKVIWLHALRNALLPVMTLAGLYLGILVTGAVVIEEVFIWPGMGRLAYQSVVTRDYPVVQGVVLVTAAVVLAANFIVDLLYGYADPRIRAQ